jgi:hypothetical protein
MSDFDHDQFDDDLGARLRRRAGGHAGSVSGAHEAVLARASHIRRRRAAVTGGAAMAIIVIGGFMLIPTGGNSLVKSESPDDTVRTVGTSVPESAFDDDDASGTVSGTGVSTTSSTVPATSMTVVPTTTPGGSPSSIVPAGNPAQSSPQTTLTPGNTSSVTTTPRTVTTGTTTVPTSSGPSTSGPSTSTPSSSTPSSSTPSTSTGSTTEPDAPTLEPFTKTYESTFGSITVSWNGTALSLVSVSPTAGAVAEIEDQEPLRIRVRFVGADDSRIEVRVASGELIETIS